MSDWYWRVIALKAAFVLTVFVSYLRADDTIRKLPFCNPHNNDPSAVNDLIIVSTLDGKLTAFATEDGVKVWDLQTQPLLSSNLHHVELTAGGKWVRLVPSLRGQLYSLSGETIEPLPFDAEQLLSSSFKYSDDLVIAGVRETQWVGIEAGSGAVVYECGGAGCAAERETAGAGRRVLVLRRRASTVRALDPRSGAEKWNFSVGEHNLAMSAANECTGPQAPPAAVGLAVALPEGEVAVRPAGDSLHWRQKLEAPVAGMWRLYGGSLHNIDVLVEAMHSLTEGPVQAAPPALYIGVHDKQLYIQESAVYAQREGLPAGAHAAPWRLQHSRPLLGAPGGAGAPGAPGAEGPAGDTALAPRDDSALSLGALYGDTHNGNHGFFLYLQETCDQAVQVTEEDQRWGEEPAGAGWGPWGGPGGADGGHPHVHVHVSSLWFWWKEVLLIAVSSALLMNLMIWPRFFAPKFSLPLPSPTPEYSNRMTMVAEDPYPRPTPPPPAVEYSSRYCTDFTQVRCLGKGGFGVVFEAKNNIDHRSYAVKRITLPKGESKRERVLREVRALAALEHEHIVRYFNAWLEEPPPAWQRERDDLWKRELKGMSVDITEDCTPSSTPMKKSKGKADSITLDLQGCLDIDYQPAQISKRNRSLSCTDSFNIEFDENAVSAHLTCESGPPRRLGPPGPPGPPGRLGPPAPQGTPGPPSADLSIVFDSGTDSYNKQLEKVKDCDGYTSTTEHSIRKKKGHKRHWSLDMTVRSGAGPAGGAGGAGRAGGPEPPVYLYIQMQLCLPHSLHHWLREPRPLSQRREQASALFSQIVSAVEYVHGAGLIHRDLKPSNIFFAPDGRVKVGDFGLVTAMGGDWRGGGDGPGGGRGRGAEGVGAGGGRAPAPPPHAAHTHRVGTHLYMSPEQMQGRPYSYKVDIYSLGLILFELMQPFGTESERVASLLRLRAGNYPSELHEDCPSETEALKLMLSSDPARRPDAAQVRAKTARTGPAVGLTL